jgi:hypothetical protein
MSAFGVAAPDFSRLAWHGVDGRLRRQPIPSAAQRAGAVAEALEALPLTRQAAMALAASAKASGVDLALARARRRPASIEKAANAPEPSEPASRAVIVGRMAMAMLGGPGIAPEAWLTVAEVAALLRLEECDVEALIEAGYLKAVTLPAFCAGPRLRIRPRDLDGLWRLLERNSPCHDGSSRAFPPAPGSSNVRDPTPGRSSGTIPTSAACVDGQPAPRTAPRLKLPGRGFQPGPGRPTRRRPQAPPS